MDVLICVLPHNKQTNINENCAAQLCLKHDAVVVALDFVHECPVYACVCSAERGERSVRMFFSKQTNKQILDTEYQNSAKQLCLNHNAVVVALDLVCECPVYACVCSAERGEEKVVWECFFSKQTNKY